jgi:hypothetical protein
MDVLNDDITRSVFQMPEGGKIASTNKVGKKDASFKEVCFLHAA